MKATFYVCLLFFIGSQYSIFGQKGTLQYKSGEQLEVEILLPKMFFGSFVDWYAMENNVYFIDLKSNESLKSNAKEIAFFEFDYKGVKKKYVSVWYEYKVLNRKLGRNLFGMVKEEGLIETIEIKGKRNEYFQNHGPNGASSGSFGKSNYKFLVFRKKSGEILQASYKFRKTWTEFTADCPAISEKVSNGQYSIIKPRKIVSDYNVSCGNTN